MRGEGDEARRSCREQRTERNQEEEKGKSKRDQEDLIIMRNLLTGNLLMIMSILSLLDIALSVRAHPQTLPLARRRDRFARVRVLGPEVPVRVGFANDGRVEQGLERHVVLYCERARKYE